MIRHWPTGPHIVHPGSDTHCNWILCLGTDLRMKRHEYLASCSCGETYRDRPKDVVAAMRAHMDEQLRAIRSRRDPQP